MPFIHAVHCALPRHRYDQQALIEGLRRHWGDQFFNFSRLEDFHRNVMVQNRYLALSMEEYAQGQGLEFRNNAWIRVSVELLREAVTGLLEGAQLNPSEIGLIASASSSGIAVPSLEARLMNLIPFSHSTKRLPIFGLGCLAGVAGINRVADYLTGHPSEAALFLDTEISSLTVQLQDLSVANLISTGLFGDGAAAVLLVGDRHPLARQSPLSIERTRSAFFPDTERVMGWDVVDAGLKVVLDSKVPQVVLRHFPQAVEQLLQDHDLTRENIGFFIAHPGGPKVLAAMEQGLQLKTGELHLSWESLKNYGNMSSVSVLFVLNDFLGKPASPGSWGLMASMGPAFCAELSLLKTR